GPRTCAGSARAPRPGPARKRVCPRCRTWWFAPGLRARTPPRSPPGSAHQYEPSPGNALSGLHAIEVDAAAQALALIAAAIQSYAVQSGCHEHVVEHASHAASREVVELDAHRSRERRREAERGPG